MSPTAGSFVGWPVGHRHFGGVRFLALVSAVVLPHLRRGVGASVIPLETLVSNSRLGCLSWYFQWLTLVSASLYLETVHFSLKNHFAISKTLHVTVLSFGVFNYSHSAWKFSNRDLTILDLALFCSLLRAVFSGRLVALTARYQGIRTRQ